MLFVSTNRERSPLPAMPIGLAAVASTLEAQGVEVAVVDLCFKSHPLLALGRAVRRFEPDYVGLSVRNLDNADSVRPVWYLAEVKSMVKALRGMTAVPVIVGGSAVGVAPRAVLDYLGADYALIGDGEEGLPALLEALESGEPLERIPGLVFRGRGTLLTNPPAQNGMPHSRPQLERWLDIRRYLRAGATVPIQTKRGCSFRCTYCTYRTIEGARYRLRDPKSVIDEAEHLLRTTGARDFEFVDSTFNNPLPHAMALCEAIVERNLPVRFHSGSLTPANCTEELLSLMARGRFSTVVTAESASDPVLKAMAKGYTASQVHEAAQAIGRARLPALWIFLMGGPGETDGTVRETFRFIAEEIRPKDVAYVTWGVRVYPGTPLADRLKSEGGPASEAELLRPTFYLSPKLDQEKALEELRVFGLTHTNVITATESQQRLVPRLMHLAGSLGVPHPHWRFVPWMKRLQRWVASNPKPQGGSIHAVECRYQLR